MRQCTIRHCWRCRAHTFCFPFAVHSQNYNDSRTGTYWAHDFSRAKLGKCKGNLIRRATSGSNNNRDHLIRLYNNRRWFCVPRHEYFDIHWSDDLLCKLSTNSASSASIHTWWKHLYHRYNFSTHRSSHHHWRGLDLSNHHRRGSH